MHRAHVFMGQLPWVMLNVYMCCTHWVVWPSLWSMYWWACVFRHLICEMWRRARLAHSIVAKTAKVCGMSFCWVVVVSDSSEPQARAHKVWRPDVSWGGFLEAGLTSAWGGAKPSPELHSTGVWWLLWPVLWASWVWVLFCICIPASLDWQERMFCPNHFRF